MVSKFSPPKNIHHLQYSVVLKWVWVKCKGSTKDGAPVPVKYGLKRHRGQERGHSEESCRAVHWMGSKNSPGGWGQGAGKSRRDSICKSHVALNP